MIYSLYGLPALFKTGRKVGGHPANITPFDSAKLGNLFNEQVSWVDTSIQIITC